MILLPMNSKCISGLHRWFSCMVVETLHIYGTYHKRPSYDLLKRIVNLPGRDTEIAAAQIQRQFRDIWSVAPHPVSGPSDHHSALDDSTSLLTATSKRSSRNLMQRLRSLGDKRARPPSLSSTSTGKVEVGEAMTLKLRNRVSMCNALYPSVILSMVAPPSNAEGK